MRFRPPLGRPVLAVKPRPGGRAVLRVAVVSAHSAMRTAICAALDTSFATIIGEADGARNAIALAAAAHPDVAIIDLDATADSIATARQIRRHSPATQVILVSTEAALQQKLVDGLRAGARGVVLTSDPAGDLSQALAEVASGLVHLSPSISDAMLKCVLQRQVPAPTELSEREREVLTLLIQGMKSREIGTRLGITTSTVDAHKTRIRTKMGVQSTAQAVLQAIEHGLTAAAREQ
ncbi:MAG: response regulator transcription factor [Candidatus Schekmanbacteria bacterium]|nr:response regulator transcription factor [Candidatus Schekmanbacteria bacterium]